MSKTITHVLIPYTTSVACGAPSHYKTVTYREQVTCKLCKKSEHYKLLPVLPKKYRKDLK